MVSRPAADGGAARMEAAEEKAALVSPPAASFRFAARLAAAEEKAGLIAKDAPHATEVGAALMMTAEPPIASSSSVLSGSSGSPSRLEEIRMRRNLAEIAGRSKIEEITERTLALEAALDASTSAPTDAGKGSETESGGSDEITALRSVVTTLRSELRMSRSVGLSATARIANLERENAALRSDLRSIYTNLRRSRTELSQLGTRTELERCLVQAVAMLDDMGVELSKALKDEGMVRTVAGRVVEAREVVKLQDAAATSVGAERAKISSKLAARGILLPPTPEEEAARIAATEEEAKEECAGEVVDEEAALIIAEEEESAPIAAVEEEVAPITAVKEEVAPGVYSDKIAALRSEVTALRSELRMSRSVGLSATARIANLERENAALRSDLRSIYTNLRRSRTELSQLGTRTELERCLVQAVAMLDDMGVELSKALKDEGMVRTVAGRVVEAREVVKLQDKDREVMEGRVIAEQLGLACAASLRSERAKVVTQLAESGILPPLTAVEEGSEDFQDVMADDIDLINAGITQSAARMERLDPTDDVTSEDVKANLEEEDKSAMLIQSTWRWNTVGHADSADGALINDATSERNTEEFGADFEDVVLEDWMVKV